MKHVLMLLAVLLLFPLGCASLAASVEPRPPTPTPEVYLVAEWDGVTNKNTETFSVASPAWAIGWETTGGYFSVEVMSADGRRLERAVSLIGPGRDGTLIRGAGRYYLKITASEPYKVAVTATR